MITAKQWLKENDIVLQEDENGAISGSEFAKYDLPMVVSCFNCEMTMVFFSALIDGDGRIFCSECGGEYEEEEV